MQALSALFRRVSTWMFLIVMGAVMLILGELSALLAKLVGAGARADMAALTRPHIGTSPITNAVSTWESSDSPHLAAEMIQASIYADFFFIVGYGLALVLFVNWCRQGMPAATKWLWLGIGIGVAADVTEDFASLVLSDSVYHGQSAATPAVVVLMVASWTKWVFLGLTVVIAFGVRLARPRDALSGNYDELSRAGRLRDQLAAFATALPAQRPRVWARLRVQVVCVAVFAFLIAFPAGGPLDQVPDTIRTVANSERWWMPLPLLLLRMLPIVLLLCPAIWVIGRLALLDIAEANPTPKSKSHSLLSLSAATLVFIVVYVAFAVSTHRLHTGVQIDSAALGVPIVAVAVIALTGVICARPPWDTSSETVGFIDRPRARHRRMVRDASLILTMLPLAAFGLGVMRAFFASAVIDVDDSRKAWALTAAGLAIAIIGSLVVFYGIQLFERTVFNDETLESDQGVTGAGVEAPENPPGESTIEPGSTIRRISVLVVGAVVAVAVAVAVIGLALWPFSFANAFHVVGIIAVFLAALAMLGGFAQYRAEIRTPMALFRRMKLRHSPVILIAVAVLVVAGLLNVNTRYHDVRVENTAQPLDSTPLSRAVTIWGEQAIKCSARLAGGSIPMLFIAAPGGGIRAAYWTDHALAVIEQTPCGTQRVFAASGVSGSSVGLALRYAPPAHGGGAFTALNEFPSTDLASETALSVNVAGTFFRDLPASIVGLSRGWDDRAGLLERAWEKDDADLAQDFYKTMKPGPIGSDSRFWRPILVFNGTEVSTGCRVLVSTTRLAAANVATSAQGCRANQLSTDPATQVVPGALDEQDFSAGNSCTSSTALGMTIATAAHMSARFPYVSPTGALYGCRPTTTTGPGNQATSITDSDGGANENSGLDTLLNIMRTAKPAIDAFPNTHPSVYLQPILVLLHNGYVSTATPKATTRSPQFVAPISLLSAHDVAVDENVLLQRAQITFGNYTYLVAPKDRPTVEAPLGWTLSKITQDDLSRQLDADAKQTCPPTPTPPSTLGCLLQTLNPKP
jgi:hypothetical protein